MAWYIYILETVVYKQRGVQKVEGFDWYIVTILNQDGYQATREGYVYV